MFVELFASIFQFCFIALIVTIVWHVFLSDLYDMWRGSVKEKSKAKDGANKIAQVKLISDDSKEIEKFITANAQYLTDDIVKQLVARMEMIKSEEMIRLDKNSYENSIKKRIDALQLVEDEVEQAQQKMRR